VFQGKRIGGKSPVSQFLTGACAFCHGRVSVAVRLAQGHYTICRDFALAERSNARISRRGVQPPDGPAQRLMATSIGSTLLPPLLQLYEFPRRKTVNAAKGPGKLKGVGESEFIRHVADSGVGRLQPLCGIAHFQTQDILPRTAMGESFEQSTEVRLINLAR
jgi:hypothetical protein